jgi:ketosteroid isomerase-like protein
MSQALSTEEMAAVKHIQSVHDAWIAAELAGDIEGVLRLCTVDVRWLTPGSGEVVGRAAGRRLLNAGSAELEHIRTTDIRIEVSGGLAYKTSRFETGYRQPTSAQTHLTNGVHLWILRLVNGVWRVALVTWQRHDSAER